MHPIEIEIIQAMARTLFVSTYADAYDNGDLHRLAGEAAGYHVESETDPAAENWYWWKVPDDSGEKSEFVYDTDKEAWEAVCEHAGIHIHGASMGADWMDVAPEETPIACVMEAAMAIGEWLHSVRMSQKEYKHVSLYHYFWEAIIADRAEELAAPRQKMLDEDKKAGRLTWMEWATQREPTLEELNLARAERDDDSGLAIPNPGSRRGATYAEEFGYCLAMTGMGHGVSWFDDHAQFDLLDFSPWISGVTLEDLGFDPKTLLDEQ